MATILAFDRKCSTWCAVQYLPLQGLRQCYINLWRTWRSLSSRRCKTYTRWDKNQMRILIFMILILFIGISFSGWGNRWAPLSPVRSLSYSWHLHLHQLLFRYIEGGGNSPNQTFSPLILFYWIALLFSYLLIPPILLTDYFISWMREQSLVLFSPSGRRKMENMKLFEHPEVLEFDQRGEGWTWLLLAYHPSYHFMCMFCFNVQFQVALVAISYWVVYPLPHPEPSLFTPPLQSSQVE